jgi:hypothetical protein
MGQPGSIDAGALRRQPDQLHLVVRWTAVLEWLAILCAAGRSSHRG